MHKLVPCAEIAERPHAPRAGRGAGRGAAGPSRPPPRAALPPCLLLLLLLLAALTSAAPPALPAAPSAKDLLPLDRSPRHEFVRQVEGSVLYIELEENDYLKITCNGTLEAERPPAFERDVRVARARLACPPPAGGYRAALAALGAELAAGGELTLELPAGGAPPLAAAHLAGLRLGALALHARTPGRPPPAPCAGLLAGDAAAALTRLEAHGVLLPPDALERPPPGLRRLVLRDANATRVPAAALGRLQALAARGAAGSPDLSLEGAAPRLEALHLRARAPPDWARMPALLDFSLAGWEELRPSPWPAHAALRRLTLTVPCAETLPPRWLASLPALRALELSGARALRELPEALLEGCAELAELVLRYGALRALPPRLFDAAPALRVLDLTGNGLTVLPGGAFVRLVALESLSLAQNDLTEDAFGALGALRRLQALDLSRNTRLGDACAGGPHLAAGESALRGLRALRSLALSDTRVTRICRDWRLALTQLRALELRRTRISHLTFQDLQYARENASECRVDLAQSPVETLEYSAEEYERALRGPPAAPVLVALSGPLRCDCRAHFAMRALRERPAHVRLRGARCAAPAPAPEDMLCEVPRGAAGSPCARAPSACACGTRPLAAALRLVRLRCEGAGLVAPPPLAAAPELRWDLRLARNNVTRLDALPSGLLMLDLSDNGLREVSGEAAAALAGVTELRLAGNPLDCSCAAAPLLRVLAALPLPAAAAAGAVCAGGGAPPAAPACGGAGGAAAAALTAVLAALALGATAAGAALARPAARARLKGALVRWGWLPRGTAPAADAARRYDAFVSFAHEDEAFARALAARLETGPRPLRLCVHSRDWAPGEYICAQIAASVAGSRRTVALVSRAFLRSAWARAEFREAAAAGARDRTPRLVVVLLEDAAALPLDRELRRYFAANTYLRADHPRFWERLRDALPPPSEPPPLANEVPPLASETPPAPAPLASAAASCQAGAASCQAGAASPAPRPPAL